MGDLEGRNAKLHAILTDRTQTGFNRKTDVTLFHPSFGEQFLLFIITIIYQDDNGDNDECLMKRK